MRDLFAQLTQIAGNMTAAGAKNERNQGVAPGLLGANFGHSDTGPINHAFVGNVVGSPEALPFLAQFAKGLIPDSDVLAPGGNSGIVNNFGPTLDQKMANFAIQQQQAAARNTPSR